MRDEMAVYAGVADSYKDFPLSALRHLQSILSVEIEARLESFGEYSLGKSEANSGDNVVGSVAEVVSKNVANHTLNNVIIGNFSGGKQ